MEFDNLRKFSKELGFKAENICTEWGQVKGSDCFDKFQQFDFFPEMDENGIVSMRFRTVNGGCNSVKITKRYTVQKNTDIFDIICKFHNNIKNSNGKMSERFLIVGNKEHPSGLITLAGLNKEEVSALMWRIIRNIEISIKKAIGPMDESMVRNALDEKRSNKLIDNYRKEVKEKLDLGLTNLLSIEEIRLLLKNRSFKLEQIPQGIKSNFTKDVVRLRNRVSHHTVERNLITNTNEFVHLYQTMRKVEQISMELSKIVS